MAPPQPRDYHGVNWTGAKTLYVKEVKRFWKVGMQTLAAPVLNALLYLLIFVVAMVGVRPAVDGVPFAIFIGPGLIMMSVLNAAFANSSSSLMQAKNMGLVQDFMTPPLTPTEQVAALVAASLNVETNRLPEALRKPPRERQRNCIGHAKAGDDRRTWLDR